MNSDQWAAYHITLFMCELGMFFGAGFCQSRTMERPEEQSYLWVGGLLMWGLSVWAPIYHTTCMRGMFGECDVCPHYTAVMIVKEFGGFWAWAHFYVWVVWIVFTAMALMLGLFGPKQYEEKE